MAFKMKGMAFKGKKSPMKIKMDSMESLGPKALDVKVADTPKPATTPEVKAEGKSSAKGANAATAITGVMGLASQAMEETPRGGKTVNPASRMRRVGG
jgi:hypothetical protein